MSIVYFDKNIFNDLVEKTISNQDAKDCLRSILENPRLQKLILPVSNIEIFKKPSALDSDPDMDKDDAAICWLLGEIDAGVQSTLYDIISDLYLARKLINKTKLKTVISDSSTSVKLFVNTDNTINTKITTENGYRAFDESNLINEYKTYGDNSVIEISQKGFTDLSRLINNNASLGFVDEYFFDNLKQHTRAQKEKLKRVFGKKSDKDTINDENFQKIYTYVEDNLYVEDDLKKIKEGVDRLLDDKNIKSYNFSFDQQNRIFDIIDPVLFITALKQTIFHAFFDNISYCKGKRPNNTIKIHIWSKFKDSGKYPNFIAEKKFQQNLKKAIEFYLRWNHRRLENIDIKIYNLLDTDYRHLYDKIKTKRYWWTNNYFIDNLETQGVVKTKDQTIIITSLHFQSQFTKPNEVLSDFTTKW